jgi:N-acetylmuramoyl-L-alanine amidase
MNIIDTPSPNHGPRAEGKQVKFIILHYTDVPNAEHALHLLQSPEKQVSAHYLVDEDGTVMKLVDEDRRAWHAGKSYWAGEEDINSCSIGIELQNPGHQFGYEPYFDEQLDALKALCKAIMARHKILPHNVLAHSDIAPARKLDPGELFPWREFALEGIGIWPEAKEHAEGNLNDLLIKYGYDPRIDAETLKSAFRRHFAPCVFLGEDADEINDVELIADLLRQISS